MRVSPILPAVVVAAFVLSTMSHAGAEPAKRKRTPTPTVTATGVAAPARATAVTPTVPPSPVPARPTAAAAPAPPPAAGPARADVEAGKVAYDKFCKKCHGEKGEGVARMYALVDAKLLSLGSRQTQSKSDQEIKKSINDGIGKMEPVEDVTPQQVNQIVAFMVTFAAFLFLWVINWIGSFSGPTVDALTKYLSIVDHFDDFGKGVIDTTHVTYYVSFITFALFLTAKSVDSERWRG